MLDTLVVFLAHSQERRSLRQGELAMHLVELQDLLRGVAHGSLNAINTSGLGGLGGVGTAKAAKATCVDG
eukprot:3928078-Lingulodinium_polyedra.AAC.1